MSSFALKLAAACAMLTDHAAVAFMPYLPPHIYWSCRLVGRLAMPIYCCLIAEGMLKTGSKKRYLTRLAVFAVVSEIPFDLIVRRRLWDTTHQNVLFTLFFGLLGITLFDRFAQGNRRAEALLSLLCCGFAALALKTDYSIFGVYFVFVFYFSKGSPKTMTALFVAGVLLLSSASLPDGGVMWAAVTLGHIAALPLLLRRSGARGFWRPWAQWAFYVFYPAHFLLLYALRSVWHYLGN
ncbi:MAG: conjugal transfer protein TraX [Oscillospiraceae bacterium]|jgi:hypothetical protein|nr:conjugal transfer protein TraX [Oscillospiraceae bacterium]